jgi:putative transposase
VQRRDAALRVMKDGAGERLRSDRLGDGDLPTPGPRPDRSDPKTVRRDRPPDNPEIREEMDKIAEKRRRFGYHPL